ncbi:MAG: VOC family protein [Planctomycetes bacterium]|nr:VOC family protein [Planctomycetota bacterium]
MKVDAVLETCLYCADLAEAERFYTEVLGMTVYARKEDRHLFLRCGAQMFLLFNPRSTSLEGPSAHGAFGAGHTAFAITEKDLSAWRAWLLEKDVPIDSEVAWPNGGHSIYFHDPAGNHLEVATHRVWELPEPA